MRRVKRIANQRVPARRRIRPRWQRIAMRRIAFAMILGVLGGAGVWLWQSEWLARQTDAAMHAAYALSANAGLVVQEVKAEGRLHTSRDEVLAALRVERGMPILAFQPWAVKARLEALPWIQSAAVQRRLPHTIFVRLVERTPLARWQLDGSVSVIDTAETVISSADADEFPHLPLVVGEGAQSHAAELFAMLSGYPEILRRLNAAVRVSQRRWNLQMRDGVTVRLPEEHTAEALTQLAWIEREHGVFERGVSMIDLRVPDRLVVRMISGAHKAINGGEET